MSTRPSTSDLELVNAFWTQYVDGFIFHDLEAAARKAEANSRFRDWETTLEQRLTLLKNRTVNLEAEVPFSIFRNWRDVVRTYDKLLG